MNTKDYYKYYNCKIDGNSQISFTNCPLMKHLEFNKCEIKSGATIDFSKWPALDTLEFWLCTIDLDAWQLITDEITRSSVKQLNLTFGKDFNNEFLNHLQKCNIVEKIDITIGEDTCLYGREEPLDIPPIIDLINLHSLIIWNCIFEADSQISFTNCPSLKYLEFNKCYIMSGANIEFSKLPVLDTLGFDECRIDREAWLAILDEITRSSAKRLKIPYLFLVTVRGEDLFECLENYIENIEIYLSSYIRKKSYVQKYRVDTLSEIATEMKGLKSITFDSSRFAGRMKDISMAVIAKAGQERDPNFKIVLHNKNYFEYFGCTIDDNSKIPFTNCPLVKNLEFNKCDIKSSASIDFSKLPALDTIKFERCTIDSNSQLSVTNCPSLKHLKWVYCEIESISSIDFSKLPALDTLKFDRCTIDLTAWQSITDEITRSSVKRLNLDSYFFQREENSQFFTYLQQCEYIENIEIHVYSWMSRLSMMSMNVLDVLEVTEEQLTINLSNLARKMKRLQCITFDKYSSERMKHTNMVIIEKAGQERDPNFKIRSDKERNIGQDPANNDAAISLQPSGATKPDMLERNCSCM